MEPPLEVLRRFELKNSNQLEQPVSSFQSLWSVFACTLFCIWRDFESCPRHSCALSRYGGVEWDIRDLWDHQAQVTACQQWAHGVHMTACQLCDYCIRVPVIVYVKSVCKTSEQLCGGMYLFSQHVNSRGAMFVSKLRMHAYHNGDDNVHCKYCSTKPSSHVVPMWICTFLVSCGPSAGWGSQSSL